MARSDDLAADDPIFTCEETLAVDRILNAEYLEAIRKMRAKQTGRIAPLKTAKAHLGTSETLGVVQPSHKNLLEEFGGSKEEVATNPTQKLNPKPAEIINEISIVPEQSSSFEDSNRRYFREQLNLAKERQELEQEKAYNSKYQAKKTIQLELGQSKYTGENEVITADGKQEDPDRELLPAATPVLRRYAMQAPLALKSLQAPQKTVFESPNKLNQAVSITKSQLESNQSNTRTKSTSIADEFGTVNVQNLVNNSQVTCQLDNDIEIEELRRLKAVNYIVDPKLETFNDQEVESIPIDSEMALQNHKGNHLKVTPTKKPFVLIPRIWMTTGPLDLKEEGMAARAYLKRKMLPTNDSPYATIPELSASRPLTDNSIPMASREPYTPFVLSSSPQESRSPGRGLEKRLLKDPENSQESELTFGADQKSSSQFMGTKRRLKNASAAVKQMSAVPDKRIVQKKSSKKQKSISVLSKSLTVDNFADDMVKHQKIKLLAYHRTQVALLEAELSAGKNDQYVRTDKIEAALLPNVRPGGAAELQPSVAAMVPLVVPLVPALAPLKLKVARQKTMNLSNLAAPFLTHIPVIAMPKRKPSLKAFKATRMIDIRKQPEFLSPFEVSEVHFQANLKIVKGISQFLLQDLLTLDPLIPTLVNFFGLRSSYATGLLPSHFEILKGLIVKGKDIGTCGKVQVLLDSIRPRANIVPAIYLEMLKIANALSRLIVNDTDLYGESLRIFESKKLELILYCSKLSPRVIGNGDTSLKVPEINPIFPYVVEVIQQPFQIIADCRSCRSVIQNNVDLRYLVGKFGKNSKFRFQIRSFRTNDITENTEWPESLEYLCLNDSMVPIVRSGISNFAVVNSLMRSGENELIYSFSENQDKTKFSIVFEIVVSCTADDAVRAITATSLITKDNFRKLLKSKDAGGDIESIGISLICPISKRVMFNPCRNIHCSHVECFDLSSWLTAYSQIAIEDGAEVQPYCPICRRKTYISDIAIVPFLKTVLASQLVKPDCIAIQYFFKSEHWAPLVPVATRLPDSVSHSPTLKNPVTKNFEISEAVPAKDANDGQVELQDEVVDNLHIMPLSEIIQTEFPGSWNEHEISIDQTITSEKILPEVVVYNGLQQKLTENIESLDIQNGNCESRNDPEFANHESIGQDTQETVQKLG